jgi:hypothetical protein
MSGVHANPTIGGSGRQIENFPFKAKTDRAVRYLTWDDLPHSIVAQSRPFAVDRLIDGMAD